MSTPGPHQVTANMNWPTFEACLDVIHRVQPRTVDLTGGAPELNPHFRRFVQAVREAGVQEVIDRCNLSVLLLPAQQDLIDFLAEHQVHIVASLPAVSAAQTDAQRGDGIFDKSIEALQRLNAAGYGQADTGLDLTLISNPTGAFLPPPQSSAEKRFKDVLKRRYGIVFTRLIELTNMPINRFLEYLVDSENFDGYMERLSAAFNPRRRRRAHVSQHAIGRMGWEALRLRLQPDARDARCAQGGPDGLRSALRVARRPPHPDRPTLPGLYRRPRFVVKGCNHLGRWVR